jgi:hypothetical protein
MINYIKSFEKENETYEFRNLIEKLKYITLKRWKEEGNLTDENIEFLKESKLNSFEDNFSLMINRIQVHKFENESIDGIKKELQDIFIDDLNNYLSIDRGVYKFLKEEKNEKHKINLNKKFDYRNKEEDINPDILNNISKTFEKEEIRLYENYRENYDDITNEMKFFFKDFDLKEEYNNFRKKYHEKYDYIINNNINLQNIERNKMIPDEEEEEETIYKKELMKDPDEELKENLKLTPEELTRKYMIPKEKYLSPTFDIDHISPEKNFFPTEKDEQIEKAIEINRKILSGKYTIEDPNEKDMEKALVIDKYEEENRNEKNQEGNLLVEELDEVENHEQLMEKIRQLLIEKYLDINFFVMFDEKLENLLDISKNDNKLLNIKEIIEIIEKNFEEYFKTKLNPNFDIKNFINIELKKYKNLFFEYINKGQFKSYIIDEYKINPFKFKIELDVLIAYFFHGLYNILNKLNIKDIKNAEKRRYMELFYLKFFSYFEDEDLGEFKYDLEEFITNSVDDLEYERKYNKNSGKEADIFKKLLEERYGHKDEFYEEDYDLNEENDEESNENNPELSEYRSEEILNPEIDFSTYIKAHVNPYAPNFIITDYLRERNNSDTIYNRHVSVYLQKIIHRFEEIKKLNGERFYPKYLQDLHFNKPSGKIGKYLFNFRKK